MRKKLLKLILKWKPVRWVMVDYCLFTSKYQLYRTRGDSNALLLAEEWVTKHTHGKASIFKSRPRWNDTKKFIEIPLDFSA